MTNADVATLATKDVIENPVNPFTNNPINNSEKLAHDQYILTNGEWIVDRNNGYQFAPGRWYKVHDSIWDKSNWEKVAEKDILTKEDAGLE